MAEIGCRYFNGYKPCGYSEICDASCKTRDLIETRVLIVHLEALGAVLRSTSLLDSIKKKYPRSHVTWVTKKPADQLLQNLNAIDRVLTLSQEDLLRLSALQFDVAFVIDKSQVSAGVLKQTQAKSVFGFVLDPKTGSIVGATPAAQELWEIGLSNHKKFFVNKKSETELICRALELPYTRNDYQLEFTSSEALIVSERRRAWAPSGEVLIGLNTGCAGVIPYKKLTVDFQRQLVLSLNESIPRLTQKKIKFVLLGGGAEDTERNKQIAKGLDVILSPTENGLRDGFCSLQAVDIVITGDSLGMHMAIAAKKWVVAWFGPTCAHEIDLFERGVAVMTQAPCSPCWKRFCDKSPMCYDLVPISEFEGAVMKGMNWLSSSIKQPLSATSY